MTVLPAPILFFIEKLLEFVVRIDGTVITGMEMSNAQKNSKSMRTNPKSNQLVVRSACSRVFSEFAKQRE